MVAVSKKMCYTSPSLTCICHVSSPSNLGNDLVSYFLMVSVKHSFVNYVSSFLSAKLHPAKIWALCQMFLKSHHIKSIFSAAFEKSLSPFGSTARQIFWAARDKKEEGFYKAITLSPFFSEIEHALMISCCLLQKGNREWGQDMSEHVWLIIDINIILCFRVTVYLHQPFIT